MHLQAPRLRGIQINIMSAVWSLAAVCLKNTKKNDIFQIKVASLSLIQTNPSVMVEILILRKFRLLIFQRTLSSSDSTKNRKGIDIGRNTFCTFKRINQLLIAFDSCCWIVTLNVCFKRLKSEVWIFRKIFYHFSDGNSTCQYISLPAVPHKVKVEMKLWQLVTAHLRILLPP